MRARVLHSLFVLLVAGVTAAPARPADEVQLTPPPALVESLAWHQDPESVLQAFRVPRTGTASAATAPRAGRTRGTPGGPTLLGRRPSPVSDVPVAVEGTLIETQPFALASPGRQDTVLVAYVAAAFPTSPGTRCFVARSLDRGRTWTRRAQLPTLSPASNCGDPTLAYSPDGSRLYAAYRDIRSVQEFLPEDPTRFRVETATHVVVSQSRDDGRTWSAPVVALAATPYSVTYYCPGGLGTCVEPPVEWTPGTSYERPSLAVGSVAPRGRQPRPSARVVHVASTRMAELDEAANPTTIVVTRSLNDGASWSSPLDLDAGQPFGPRVITQGPRIAAGSGAEALVAWYHSGFDGWLAGGFEVRTARTGDAGATWDPIVTAAADPGETRFRLGPYRRWWTTMFPDAAIDADGRAHVVYTHDPVAGSTTAEEGDIRYVASPLSPHADWSDPVTVNDDGQVRAQGFASLVTRRQQPETVVEVVWEDTRLAPGGSAATALSLYDVFHARLAPGQGTGWSASTRVSDESSTQTQTSSAGRTSVTANRTGVVFAAWSDRRGVGLITDSASNVHGSPIDPR